MINRYRNFLFEDWEGDSNKELKYYSLGFDTSPESEQRVSRFLDFIDKLKGKDQSPSSPQSDVDDEDSDNPVESPGGNVSTSFSGDNKKKVDTVLKYLNEYGITNPLVQKAILSNIGKESGFTTFKETSYKNTSPDRIRKIYGDRFKDLSDSEIDEIKKDDKKFWEKVYGGEWGRRNLGNTEPGDGWRYVGRGFNGITGRANYKNLTDLLKKRGKNIDLIANPEKLDSDLEIAAEANALYFLHGLVNPIIRKRYGNTDPNDFKDFETALKAVVNTNAGPGIKNVTGMEGYTKALAASKNFNIDTSNIA